MSVSRAEIETALRDFFAADPRGCLAVWLFGSVARDQAHAKSDVDVAALREDPRGDRFDFTSRLESELERVLRRDVQVIAAETAPPDLVHRVLRDGRLILDRNPSARIAFEVRARNEYFDLKPFLDRYRFPPEPR